MQKETKKKVLIAICAGAVAFLSVFLGYKIGSGSFGGSDEENPLSMSYDDSKAENGRSGIVKITATCSASVKEGQEIPADQIKVMRVYADGTEKEVKNFSYDPANLSSGGNNGTVYTPYGAVALDVDYVAVTGLKTRKTYYAGQIPDTSDLVAVYADGSEENVDPNDIEMSRTSLSAGLNQIPVKLNGHDHVLFIRASEATYAQKAASSDTTRRDKRIEETALFAGMEEYSAYDLVHVVINTPAQIGSTTGTSGVGILSGSAVSSGVFVSNGQVVGGDTTSGHEICVTQGGALFSPGAGYSSQDLITSGTVMSFITDAPLLINNGGMLGEGNSDAIYYNAVGMVNPGEYYLLVSGQGLSCADMQQVFAAVGCTWARPLTGSASLLWNGEALFGSSVSGSALMFNNQ